LSQKHPQLSQNVAFVAFQIKRYVEVVFGGQKPLRIFKLDTLQDDDVLHRLAHFYADKHELIEGNKQCIIQTRPKLVSKTAPNQH
jgi:hypothetical protein